MRTPWPKSGRGGVGRVWCRGVPHFGGVWGAGFLFLGGGGGGKAGIFPHFEFLQFCFGSSPSLRVAKVPLVTSAPPPLSGHFLNEAPHSPPR